MHSSLPRDPATGRYLSRQARDNYASSSTNSSSKITSSRRAASPSSPPRRRSPLAPAPRVQVKQSSPPRVTQQQRTRKPRTTSSPPAQQQQPVVTFATEVPQRTSPILRSSYTRREGIESPPAQQQPVVSRREYASPSLSSSQLPAASPAEDTSAVMGPSTMRRMKRMSSAEAPSAPSPAVERFSQQQPSSSSRAASPTDLLFSYLNAA